MEEHHVAEIERRILRRVAAAMRREVKGCRKHQPYDMESEFPLRLLEAVAERLEHE